MIQLIPQTQGRLEGFSVLSHLLRPKVKSTLLSTNDLACAVGPVPRPRPHRHPPHPRQPRLLRRGQVLNTPFIVKSLYTSSWKKSEAYGHVLYTWANKLPTLTDLFLPLHTGEVT